jgi:tape measure domain-containing protein
MTQVVGSLIYTMELQTGQFQSGLRSSAAAVGSASSRMRRDADATTSSVNRMQRAFGSGISGKGLAIASRELGTMSARVNVLRQALLSTAGIFGGFSTALAINAVSSYADSYTSLQNGIKSVISETNTQIAVENELFKSAQRSRSGFKDTVTLFTRMTRATEGFGLSYKKIIDLGETTQKAFSIGGATAAESGSFAIQLSQALASNRLGGDELRAVMEGPLGGMMAKGLGISIGKMRELSKEGKLTTAVMVEMLTKAAPAIEEAFLRTHVTIGNSFTAIDNALIKFIGSQDQALGASRMFANGMLMIANNMDTIGKAILMVAGAMGALFVSRGVGNLFAGISGGIASMASARSAAIALSEANLVSAASSVRAAEANALLVAEQRLGAISAGQLAAADIAAAEAATILAAAEIRLTEAAIAANAAQRASTAGMVGATAGMRALSFVGGPLGAIILAASVAFYYLSTREDEASIAAQKHADVMNDLRGKILNSTSATKEETKALRDNIKMQIDDAKAAIANAQARLSATKSEQLAQTRALHQAQPTGQILGITTYGANPFKDYDRMTDMAQQGVAAAQAKLDDLKGLGDEMEYVQKRQTDLGNATDTAAEKLTKAQKAALAYKEALAKLKEDAIGAGLTQFQNSVVQQAQSMNVSQKKIDEYIGQARSGKASQLTGDGEMASIQRLLRIKDASEEYWRIQSKLAPTLEQVREKQAQLDLLMARGQITTAQAAKEMREYKLSFEGLKQVEDEYISIMKNYSPTILQASEKQRILNQLVAEGRITAGQAATEYTKFLTGFGDYKWIDDAGSSLQTFLQSGISDFGSIEDAAINFAKSLLNIATNVLIIQPLVEGLKNSLAGISGAGSSAGSGSGFFSTLLGGISSLFGGAPASIYHAGGIVGAGSSSRSVNASSFLNAPSFHDGLKSNEFRAILEGGEQVLTKQDQRDMARKVGSSSSPKQSQNVDININIPAIAGNSEVQTMIERGVHAGLRSFKGQLSRMNLETSLRAP